MVKGLIDKMAVARNTAQNLEKERGVGTTLMEEESVPD